MNKRKSIASTGVIAWDIEEPIFVVESAGYDLPPGIR